MSDRAAEALKILVLEPYYGGSHRSFLNGLSGLPFTFELRTLPARKWKWRMRLSAPYFAQTLRSSKQQYDRILCSSFVDVAAFRGLAPSWVNDVPVLTYFHENQFAYPVQVADERDFHFALTNMTSALSSDGTAFNSEYNMASFTDGIRRLEKKSYDLKLSDPVQAILAKSRVIPPGIDFAAIDAVSPPAAEHPPVIVWNHRWEHDKNPETFFSSLLLLKERNVDFRLIILGESFREYPGIFDAAQRSLSDNILHAGYVSDRTAYCNLLKMGDIVVSTSGHEFFGISVIEAVRAGCRPLVPNRLSYPELFQEEFLYEDDELTNRLEDLIQNGQRLTGAKAHALTDAYSWETLAPVYESWLKDPL